MIKGFKDFLLKNNVLALAIAVIVGGAVGKVVTSLAQDILMPVISPILPSGEWQKAQITIGNSAIKYGSFLGSVIDFVIISFIVYLITKALVKEPAPPPPVPTKPCPRCLEAIAPAATKCKFCTADI